MNPPFSAMANVNGRMAATTYRHIASALARLADGGRLVAPVYDGRSHSQVLVVVDRVGGRVVRRTEEPVRFVPLRRGTA
jgi:protein-L-isoaspartate O-methyltransferase